TNMNSSLDFYENKSIDTYFTNEVSGSWLKIHLEGTTSNRDGLGAVIHILDNNELEQSRLYNGSGYQHQSLQAIHFGLDDATLVNTISVVWPNTGLEVYNNINVNSTIKIVEGSGVQVINNNTSNKIPGCTELTSCNYDAQATVDDNSCEFLTSGVISGPQLVYPLETQTYTYSDAESINFLWTVANGTIVGGQGTNTVEVLWDIGTEGSLTIVGSNDTCSSTALDFDVTFELPSLDDESYYSIARLWNEVLLYSIRNDLARPTVHARNLFHTSAAIYDAWAIVNDQGSPYLMGNVVHGYQAPFDGFSNSLSDVENNNAAISYTAYRLITHRFSQSTGYFRILHKCNSLMDLLNYDTDNYDVDNNSEDPIALGNYIAENYISYGLQDGSMEQDSYQNQYYEPVNEPLAPILSGNSTITNPNRWQPLSLDVFIDQSGNILEETIPEFLGAEWGNVNPFGLDENDMTTYSRDGNNYNVYHDPGEPPMLDDNQDTNLDYINAFSMVPIWGSHLSQDDGVMLDISPNNIGNIILDSYPNNVSEYNSFYDYFNGGDNSMGYSSNPVTNQNYETQLVPRGDYARVLAEFWADGPDSETPPGHWFVILNTINDNPLLEKKFQGLGDELSNLEWDVKSYFIMGGVMHDSAISAWGIKGWYDYVRPISAIRYMADLGQSTNESLSNYNSNGLPLIDGYIEIVNEQDPLAGDEDENLGKIKLYSWKGHDFIDNPSVDQAGVGWILAENWWPYQRPTFVTPNFAGYVSGHSTYSRAAAEALTLFTGSEYFPGGMGEFIAKENEFLVFEEGPSQDIKLQWASYRDASDQCSLSRIWGGIHPHLDDIPGRLIGSIVGVESFDFGAAYFESSLSTIDIELPKLKLVSNPIYPDQSIEIINTTGDEIFKLYNINGQEIKINTFYNQYRASIFHQGLNPGIYLLKSNSFHWKILV
ncbi:MAG TPA: ASPIC/UnbV domain-containing protein, partial [Flavobacteriaceae bacterium]|nr:ASPIC/UnbV domain-containing protein [Flavobacteriaceae bacterium]